MEEEEAEVEEGSASNKRSSFGKETLFAQQMRKESHASHVSEHLSGSQDDGKLFETLFLVPQASPEGDSDVVSPVEGPTLDAPCLQWSSKQKANNTVDARQTTSRVDVRPVEGRSLQRRTRVFVPQLLAPTYL